MSGAPPQLNHIIVRAGAGAGKTTGLVQTVSEVYYSFRAQGISPRIVLTTFTRKATQELKERLIQKACRERDSQFLQFVSDPGCLHISTIHGLLNVFLRQVGHLAGLDAGFQIVSHGESSRMSRLALREAILEKPEGLKFFEIYGFQRVLQMCQRFEAAWREHGELRPASLDDLHEAAQAEAEIWRRELNDFASTVLEEVGDESWYGFALALKDFASNWQGDIGEMALLPKKPRRSKKQEEYFSWHDRADDVLNRFKDEMKSSCWRRDLWPKMVSEWTDFLPLGQSYVERLKHAKESQAQFDMADLEYKSLEILRAKPFLGEIFAEKWDFWMIDEYQDTSPLQVAVLKALIGDRPRYFVGDPQQSIYLFRGAEVGVFDETQGRLLAEGGKLVELQRNWRSRPDLLMWINDFMASLSPAFRAMLPREEPEESPARVCATMIRCENETQELEAISTRVAELMASGVGMEKICILGRTHRNLMEVSSLLRARGYPTHVHASRGFRERREVVDALSLWKFLINPHDTNNLVHLLRTPWFYVSDTWIAEMMQSRPLSLWSKISALKCESPEEISLLKAALARVKEVGLVRAFEEALYSAAYLDLCLHNDPAGRKESNLWKVIHKARALEREGGASLLNLMDGESVGDPMDASEGDATSAQEPNCINLMTVHGSKGLEFDHVIVARMGEGQRLSNTPALQNQGDLFFFSIRDESQNKQSQSPLDRLTVRRQQNREREEFDRWLYVALTRAKETLTLTWSLPIDRDSWASRSDWFQRPAEEYVSKAYRFVVSDGVTAVATDFFSNKSDEPSSIRQRWRVLSEANVGADSSNVHTTVTQLVAQSRSAHVNTVTTEDVIRRWEAQTKGSRIHKALEGVKHLGHWSGEFDVSIEYVLQLQDPPIRELMRSGFAEWGFQIKTNQGVIEGQIDLWGKSQGVLYIIDYKSGSLAFKEEAFQQLNLYAWALRKFGHSEPIRMVVLYPLHQTSEARDYVASSTELD